MWKAVTRDQSTSSAATSPARNSFWLGAAAKTTLAISLSALPRPDRLHDRVSSRPARHRPILINEHIEVIFAESGDRRQLGETHWCGNLARMGWPKTANIDSGTGSSSRILAEEPYPNFARAATGAPFRSGELAPAVATGRSR